MLNSLLAFLPVAAVLTLTPGVATALSSAARCAAGGGRRARDGRATRSACCVGDLVRGGRRRRGGRSASAELFTTIKLIGAVVLDLLGVQGLLARKADAPPPPPGTALRVGLVTSLANPKLAVFFVALFPQFIAEVLDPAASCLADRRARPSSIGPDPRVARTGASAAWCGERSRLAALPFGGDGARAR